MAAGPRSRCSGNLSISDGEPRLIVSAPSDALEHLTSEVNGDVLVLGVATGTMFGLGSVRYELTLPDLQAIAVDGSGDVVATVSADGDLRVDVNGSGDLTWTGLSSDRIDIAVEGSGDVTLSGSGDVDVSPVVGLSVDIFGSGTVSYSGEPTLETNITGSGDVVQR